MGFRFRKSFSIIPGVRINVSKSGVSTSDGEPGATVNFSERGVRGTVGLPGTGLSYSDTVKPDQAGKRAGRWILWLGLAIVVALLIFTR